MPAVRCYKVCSTRTAERGDVYARRAAVQESGTRAKDNNSIQVYSARSLGREGAQSFQGETDRQHVEFVFLHVHVRGFFLDTLSIKHMRESPTWIWLIPCRRSSYVESHRYVAGEEGRAASAITFSNSHD